MRVSVAMHTMKCTMVKVLTVRLCVSQGFLTSLRLAAAVTFTNSGGMWVVPPTWMYETT